MGRNRWWFGFVVALTIALLWVGQGMGQAPPPPETAPSPAISPSPPSPTVAPSPGATPAPTTAPTPPLLPPPPLPSTADPLPLSGDYRDPGGRFRVGILQGYALTPLAGSALVEAPDGSLSYTVVWQSQVLVDLVGLDPLLVNDRLAQVARTLFQRGEGFQPGLAQSIAPQGIQLPWQGSLTIAGQSQPISGVVLAKPSGGDGLFLLIAATQNGLDQVPGAISALWESLQAL